MIEFFPQASCNGCGESEDYLQSTTSITEMADYLARYGWVRVRGLDYCRACVADGKCASRVNIFSDQQAKPEVGNGGS